MKAIQTNNAPAAIDRILKQLRQEIFFIFQDKFRLIRQQVK